MISLFAGDERERKLDRIGDPLSALGTRIDFEVIAQRVEALLPVVDYAKGGRPRFPVLLMVKLLVLKQLYNLSDDPVEYQALDRATFQRFLGLKSSSGIPDAKVSADKGYVDAEREARLNKAGWRMKIQRKGTQKKPLGVRQSGRNTTIAKVRARVEHLFAGLHQMGGQMIRTIGLARAEFQITTKLAVYNIKRLASLHKCGIEAF